MQEIIHAVRARFARVPRWLRRFTRRRLPVAAPHWMPPDDLLHQVVRDQMLLLTKGEIVWAALVQANELMFAAGEVNCPAQLVYAPSRHYDAMPEVLFDVAHGIYRLKHTNPADAGQAELAELASNETARTQGFALPAKLAQVETRATAMLVMREHLPNRILTAHFFPILIHPATTSVMIVPDCFWPPALTKLWNDFELRGSAPAVE